MVAGFSNFDAGISHLDPFAAKQLAADCCQVPDVPPWIGQHTNPTDLLKSLKGNVDPELVFYFICNLLQNTAKITNCNVSHQIAILDRWKQDVNCFVEDFKASECANQVNTPYSTVCGTTVAVDHGTNINVATIIEENLRPFALVQLYLKYVCNATQHQVSQADQAAVLNLLMEYVAAHNAK